MRHDTGHLAKLGVLALIAAIAAVAAWTYAGQADSSGHASPQAAEHLTDFSLQGPAQAPKDGHGSRDRGASGGLHKPSHASLASSAAAASMPVTSGPVLPGRPGGASPVPTDEVRVPSPNGNAGPRMLPPRQAPKGRAPGDRPPPKVSPAPVRPRPPSPRPGAPTGGAPPAQPSNPPVAAPDPGTTPIDPGTTPTDPGTAPADPAGDPPGIDDTPVGGLDPSDLGEPVDETPGTGVAPAAAPDIRTVR